MHVNDDSAYVLRNFDLKFNGIYQFVYEKHDKMKYLSLMIDHDKDINRALLCYYNYTGFVLGDNDGLTYEIYMIKGTGTFELGSIDLPYEPYRLACSNDGYIFIATSNGIYYIDIDNNYEINQIIETDGKHITTFQIHDKELLFSYAEGEYIYHLSLSSNMNPDTSYSEFIHLKDHTNFTFYYDNDYLIVYDYTKTGIYPYELDSKNRIISSFPIIPFGSINVGYIMYAYIPVPKMATWLLVLIIIISNLPIIGGILYLVILIIYICFSKLIIPGFLWLINSIYDGIKSCCRSKKEESDNQENISTVDTTTTQQIYDTYNQEEMEVIMNDTSVSDGPLSDDISSSKSFDSKNYGEVKDDGNKDDDGTVCKECRLIKVFAMIVPCEHECLCLECGEKYRNEKRPCPICKTEIETVWPK